MRAETALVVALVLAVLVGGAGYAILGGGQSGGRLVEIWVSDTARNNQVNHHPVGVDPAGEVVVAPVSAVSGTEEMTETSCAVVGLEAGDGAVAWRAGVRPANCTTHAISGPAVADLDRDGRSEALVATTERALVGYDAATGAEELRVPLTTFGYAPPVVADVTPGAGPEAVAVDFRGLVVVARPDGRIAWRRDLSATVWASPAVGDLDGDGATEVLVVTGDRTVLLSAGGDVEWRAPAGGPYLATGQADGDPAREAYVTDTGVVVALDLAGGDVEWRQRVEGVPTTGAVGDGDGDGTAEVYVGISRGRVLALDAATGTREWSAPVASGEARAPTPPPVLGDVDGDGGREVVAVGNDGTVSVLSAATGRELAAYRRDVPVWTHATLADLDGDGASEVLVRYGDGRVVALEYRVGG